MKKNSRFSEDFLVISKDFNFSLVLKKLDIPSWPTYLPTMSLFRPRLPYLPTYPKMGRHYRTFPQCNNVFNLKYFYQIPLKWWKIYNWNQLDLIWSIWTNLNRFYPIWTSFIWFDPNNQSDSSWLFLDQFKVIWSIFTWFKFSKVRQQTNMTNG